MTELLQEPTLNSFFNPKPQIMKRGWTNNVFKIQKNNRVLYYLPAYLRMKVKNIMNIDLFTLTGEVNCIFILTIFYSEIEKQVVKYLFKSVEIAFNKNDAIKLDEENIEVVRRNDEDKKLLTFTIRKSVATRLFGNIFWSPFETVKFIISMTLRSLKTQINGKSYIFKFNLMDCDDMDTKFSLSQEIDFGIFKIAQKQLQVQYANKFIYLELEKESGKKVGNKIKQRSNETDLEIKKRSSNEKLMFDEELEPLQMKKNINNFRYAHFILSAYKVPGSAILNIFFPLLLLGIINIAIFYQDNTRTGKMEQNIAAVLVSFIALIPTVRENTAVSPTVTFTEILVFIESSTTILVLIHMVIYRNTDLFQISMHQDGLLIASVVITCLVAVCVFVLIILHIFFWRNQYHFSSKESKQLKFNHKQWYNQDCDSYFESQAPRINEYVMEFKQKQTEKFMKIQSKQV